MHTIWKDQGIKHSIDMLNYEKSHFGKVVLPNIHYEFQGDLVNFLIGHGDKIISSIEKAIQKPDSDIISFLKNDVITSQAGSELNDLGRAASNITQVFIYRLLILILSIPLFIIAFICGLSDGFAERDLRKWGGGRETNTVFDMAYSSIVPIFILTWLLYLSIPVSINPLLIVIPSVFMFGLAVKVSAEKLKKYF